jgi:hypothetical protein
MRVYAVGMVCLVGVIGCTALTRQDVLVTQQCFPTEVDIAVLQWPIVAAQPLEDGVVIFYMQKPVSVSETAPQVVSAYWLGGEVHLVDPHAENDVTGWWERGEHCTWKKVLPNGV